MQTTDLKKSVDTLQLAKIVRDGKPAPSSGSIVTCRGVSSGLRGMKCGTQRPTCIILDDLQTAETADSQEQVAKLLDVIRKDIMNLGGKQRLSVLQTATPIQPEDLVD